MYQSTRNPITGLTDPDQVLRTEDGAIIPADPLNVDWQKYQDWRAAGNTPDAPA